MTEIKKITKISLVVYAIMTFIFGILLVFLLDIFLTPMTGWTNPLHPRMFGVICLQSSVFAVILLRKKEWEEIKLMYTYLFGLFGPALIVVLTLVALLGSTFNAATISELILDTILMSSVLALGVYSYIKQ